MRTLAAYLKAGPAMAVRIEGVAPEATLAQQRVEAVRDALIEAGAESRAIERHVREHCGTGDLCMVRQPEDG